jgi:chromatin remodeling complex protein RSC6
MPRTVSKQTSVTDVQSTSSNILSGNIELSTPVITPSQKATKSKKTTKSSTDPVTSTTQSSVVLEEVSKLVPSEQLENVVLETGVDDVVLETGVLTLIEQSQEFFSKLQQMGVLMSSIKTDYRSLEKKWVRDLKVAQKKGSKGKRRAAANAANGGVAAQTRTPSGFVKPTKISDELANFLGKEKGTEMARTAVTRDINAYIRTNKLQDVDNGRKIIPDSKLATLLKLTKDDELTYFNLQKYMSPHFQKNVKVEAAVSAPTTA